LFADQLIGLKNTGHEVYGNTVEGNGFHEFGHRKGDGIRLFGSPANPAVGGADSTYVQDNQVHGNAANGIRVDSKNNTITSNDARDNAAFPGVTAFDLQDTNAGCDNNVWSANLFDTATPACTTG
jgi:parallel beta-helix repeat protein